MEHVREMDREALLTKAHVVNETARTLEGLGSKQRIDTSAVARLLPLFQPPSTRPLPRVYIAQSDEVLDEVIRNVVSCFRPEAVKELREYMRPELLSRVIDKDKAMET